MKAATGSHGWKSFHRKPENYLLIGDSPDQYGSRYKSSALALSEQAIATIPIEKDSLGWSPIRSNSRAGGSATGESDRAIAALSEPTLTTGSSGPRAPGLPLTPRAPPDQCSTHSGRSALKTRAVLLRGLPDCESNADPTTRERWGSKCDTVRITFLISGQMF